jgi:hypothetical protein
MCKKIKKTHSFRLEVRISLNGSIVYDFLACVCNRGYIGGVGFLNLSFARVLKYGN